MKKKKTPWVVFLVFAMFIGTVVWGFKWLEPTLVKLQTEGHTETCLIHKWAPATCETPKTCKWCGLTEGEAPGHQWSTWYVKKEADCENYGIMARTCSRCGKEETKTVDALGHLFGEWTVETPATCSASGLEIRTCVRCSESETRELPILPHTMEDHWTDKGFSEEKSMGYAELKCSACGEVLGTVYYNPVYCGLTPSGSETKAIGGFRVLGTLAAGDGIAYLPIMEDEGQEAFGIGACLRKNGLHNELENKTVLQLKETFVSQWWQEVTASGGTVTVQLNGAVQKYEYIQTLENGEMEKIAETAFSADLVLIVPTEEEGVYNVAFFRSAG